MVSGLIKIPFVDLRGNFSPLDLVFLRRKQARVLLEAVRATFGASANIPSTTLLKLADRASQHWLKQAGNPYLWEITRLAEEIDVPGVFTVNACLEWGCTTGVWDSADGPLMRRVMDWPFPVLGEHLVVLHLSGQAGSYYNITWPGISGVFHGLAPERFAAAINQAPMRRTTAGLAGVAGDWAMGRIAVGRNFGLPPGHLLRQVFELAPDYAAAREMLSQSEIAVPTIFVLAGTENGQACVIERTENACTIREMAAGPNGNRVCATNHFEAPPEGTKEDWRARPIDSAGKYTQASALPGDGGQFFWFTAPIANANSRVAFAARPHGGRLSLMGTDGASPVTEVFRLPPED
ncbi:MAG: hypothetical protein WCD42_09900 [Rhizomicrobium sp.]